MRVRTRIPCNFGAFSVTFTCHKWLSLIELVNGYDIVYNWFDHLKTSGHILNGYVVMPNHLHAMISFKESEKGINTVVGNGKRFIAYEIIKRLKENDQDELLQLLSDNVEAKRRQNNKQHEGWELSFDWKECR